MSERELKEEIDSELTEFVFEARDPCPEKWSDHFSGLVVQRGMILVCGGRPRGGIVE